MKIGFDLSRKTGKNITLRRGNMMISANDRMHYQVKGKITQFLRELSCYECKHTGLVPKMPYSPSRPCTVIVTVRPPTARRNDAPNWYPTVKALVDGLTDAGVWTDDNNTVIKAMTFIAGEKSGTDRYRFELEVRDVRSNSDLS